MSGQLKEVRDRIKSVNSTQQITNAMKMVSASKLRKAQNAITEMRPYADRLNKILANILSNISADEAGSSFGVVRDVENVLVVVITSNRGLAGAFNSNIIKAAAAKIEECGGADSEKVHVLCIGKKGADFFSKKIASDRLNLEYVTLFDDLTFENVAQVSQLAMDGFSAKDYDAVYVAYSRFKNAALQFASADQFLPVVQEEVKIENNKATKSDYLFEPSKEELLEELIPTILQTTFQKYILDTHASEHGARMTAMDKATENADEMLKDLKISYNKARQEAITKELSEIVGGAAALG